MTAAPHSLRHNRAFVIFATGQILSNVGDAGTMIALPLLALEATGSIWQMGLITAFGTLGRLIVGLAAGVALDRFDRRRLMIVVDTLRALIYLSIPLIWMLSGPNVVALYLATLGGSLLGAAFRIAYVTAVPSLVEREHLHAANGVLEGGYALAYVLGPLIAGLLASQLSPATVLGVDASTFLISAVSLVLVRLRPPSAQVTRRDTRWQSAFVGFRYLWQQPVLRTVAFLIAGLQFLIPASYDLFIYYLRHDLGQSNTIVGLIFGFASVGGVLAGLVTSTLRKRFGANVCFLLSLFLLGICMVGVGTTRIEWVLGLCFIGAAFADTLKSVMSQTVRQQSVPEHLLGRVAAAFWFITATLAPLGATIITAVAERVGAANGLIYVGVAVLVLFTLALISPARTRWPEAPPAVALENPLNSSEAA